MLVRFTKMHGAGNDYVYINAINQSLTNIRQLTKAISNRHKGIGADGVVLIMSSVCADFKMRMFNADGSEGEMCGNASRCVAKYVYDEGLTTERTITLETLAGVRILEITKLDNGKVSEVRVDMGEPVLEPEKIPFNSEKNFMEITVLSKTLLLYAVGMGNPHGIIVSEDIEKVDVATIGQEIQNNAIFPQSANIEFVKVVQPNKLRMRVCERGSGETLACGTGACAAVVSMAMQGLSERKVIVSQTGGDLLIEWNKENNHVYMTGEAVTVYRGEFETNSMICNAIK